ncbi:MAG: hypothetical protein WCC57_16425 [Paracoccaceae bacterium]
MNPIWLVRMVKWAKHPQSSARVKLVLGTVALCLILVAIERLVGWPDWLATNRLPRH